MLELIKHGADIVGVITKEKSIANADFSDLSDVCKDYSIDYIYTENINDSNTTNYIQSKKPDIIYCFGWSQLISHAIIKIAPKGIVGFHPTELPYNRGRHPIIWALALGLKKTASTFFYITEGADEGDILAQQTVEIDKADNASTLYDKLMKIALKQVIVITKQIEQGTINPLPQDNAKANYWRKRTPKDGEIDWRMSAISINNLIRALTKPYVGAHFNYQNNAYKVWESEVIYKMGLDNIEPGKVLKVYSQKSFLVKSGDGLVKILDCDSITLKEGEYLQ